jgi:hypothetical protein
MVRQWKITERWHGTLLSTSFLLVAPVHSRVESAQEIKQLPMEAVTLTEFERAVSLAQLMKAARLDEMAVLEWRQL